jgi:hypothetical protein
MILMISAQFPHERASDLLSLRTLSKLSPAVRIAEQVSCEGVAEPAAWDDQSIDVTHSNAVFMPLSETMGNEVS